jgi:hypothetical protein
MALEREQTFHRFGQKGEPLSGGGITSGLMSFLQVYDRAAGAIKSGGTTRRAAKMVIVTLTTLNRTNHRLENDRRTKSSRFGYWF